MKKIRSPLVIAVILIFLNAALFSIETAPAFGRLLSIERPVSPSKNSTLFTGLRKISFSLGQNWRLETNTLSDIMLLANFTIKYSSINRDSLSFVAGGGPFWFIGNWMTTNITKAFVDQIVLVDTSFRGYRLYSGVSWFRGPFDFHGQIKYARVEYSHLVDILAGVRFSPSSWFSVYLEGGYSMPRYRWKAGIGMDFHFGDFHISMGLWYNPIEDQTFNLPIIPSFDMGFSL